MADPRGDPLRPGVDGNGTVADRAGPWRLTLRAFLRNPLAVAGLVTVGVLVMAALFAPVFAPFDPLEIPDDLASSIYQPPSAEHLLGTDEAGRDLFSRLLYGARISLSVGFLAVAISVSIGTFLGALSGLLGGWVDAVVMRMVDAVIAIPRIVLLVAAVGLFRPGLVLIVVILGLTQWPGTARLVRGEVLGLKEREFVEAARALGYGTGRILLRHVIPNVLAPVIVAATLGVGNTIILEAGLSFFGLGISPPAPSWGNLVDQGRVAQLQAWWLSLFPGLAIVVTVVAFNLVGDGLRDAMDPRLRGER